MAAPYSGSAESATQMIRGIDIDKLAKGFADEANILKKYVTISKTSAREIRWYQKTAGYLDTATTDDEVLSHIDNTSFKARPFVTEQKWTRATSYIRKFFVESPIISMEDIKDSYVDVLATNVRDLVVAVANQVDRRIYGVIGECTGAGAPMTPVPSNTQSGGATADGWDDLVTGNPIKDILSAKQAIRTYRYDPEGAVILMNQAEHTHLLNYLIDVKGSSIPSFSSEKVKSGVVMELLGCNIVVSANATTDYVCVFVPDRAAKWKAFMPITSAVIDEPGIGKKIRVWEEGECILTDPKAVYWITDTITG